MWWLFDSPLLSKTARQLIDQSDQACVSAVSIYEIDFKRRDRRGRSRDNFLLRMPPDMPSVLPTLGLRLLDVTPQVAWRAARLPFEHADPWDRLLVAQALELGVPLVSADRVLLAQAGDTPVVW